MKSIIEIILFSLFLSLNNNIFAQEPKVKEIVLKVDGNCDDCKNRIESAMDNKGIKFSQWNKETKMLKVVYKPSKISEEQILELLAKTGHDSEKMKADNNVYNKLPECCKYRTGACTNHM